MNNNKVNNIKQERKWLCPVLNDGKKARIFTKHFSNLPFLISHNHFALMCYLMYNAGADNSIQYSTSLLNRYRRVVKEGGGVYGLEGNGLYCSVPKIRDLFCDLIKMGLLVKISRGEFMINPCLSYVRTYITPVYYLNWCRKYQDTGIEKISGVCEEFRNNVAEKLKKRKKYK